MTHADYLALLDRYWQQWPDLRRYEATAKRERLDYWTPDGWRWCWCVTVTVFDKRNERDTAATQAARRER